MVTDTSDESTVTNAQAKIDAAQERIAGANIPVAEKAELNALIADHQGALNQQDADRIAYRQRMAEEAEKARVAAMRARDKALYAAMGSSDDTTAPVNVLNNLATVPYYTIQIVDNDHDSPAEATGQRGERGDLLINPAAGAGSIPSANTHTSVYLRHRQPGRPGHDTTMDKVGR